MSNESKSPVTGKVEKYYVVEQTATRSPVMDPMIYIILSAPASFGTAYVLPWDNAHFKRYPERNEQGQWMLYYPPEQIVRIRHMLEQYSNVQVSISDGVSAYLITYREPGELDALKDLVPFGRA